MFDKGNISKNSGYHIRNSQCPAFKKSVHGLALAATRLQSLLNGYEYCGDVVNTIHSSPMFSSLFSSHDSLSFLSSRLSQFTKATRIFTTRDYTHTNVAAEFHQACDNIPNTLVIIKSGQYIAGGYTEVAWSSPRERTFVGSDSMSSFLFSVNDETVYP